METVKPFEHMVKHKRLAHDERVQPTESNVEVSRTLVCHHIISAKVAAILLLNGGQNTSFSHVTSALHMMLNLIQIVFIQLSETVKGNRPVTFEYEEYLSNVSFLLKHVPLVRIVIKLPRLEPKTNLIGKSLVVLFPVVEEVLKCAFLKDVSK
jgi:hypothetical protein